MWSKFLPACVTVPSDANYSWHQRDQVWGRQHFVIIPKCFLQIRSLNAGLPKNLCWWISVQTSPCRLELVPFCSCHELFVYRSKLVGVSERDFLSSLVRDLHTWILPYNMFQKIEVLHLSSTIVTVPYCSVGETAVYTSLCDFVSMAVLLWTMELPKCFPDGQLHSRTLCPTS